MDTQIDYQSLARELLAQQAAQMGGTRYKTVSSTPTTIYGHGPGGLFSTPGLSKPLFSAMILPKLGLQSRLPMRPTMEMNPLFGIITGVTASSGSEPVGVCDDPPTSGTLKLCTHSFVMGRYSRMSRVFDLDRAGKVTNRGEFLDFQIFGDPLGSPGKNPAAPTVVGMNPSQIAQNEISKALFEMAVAWCRDFAKKLYSGNPSNNTAGGGYQEFYGLDYLINTGYRDAINGQLCPAADSIVRSFGNLNISSNAATFIKAVTNVYRNLKHLAVRAGLDPVQWALSMPFGLFYEATEVWPIAYLTYRALAIPTGSTNFVNSTDVERMREDMRGDLYNYEGQFLLIDGQKVPVILDDGIVETENGDGSFTSDIYYVPLTVLGGAPVTYMEAFNYESPNGSLEMAKLFAPGDTYYTTDGGIFLWHKKPPTNYCVQLLVKTEPRLIMLTPYLAARITSVKYLPVYHERSPFTTSGYFVDGGNYTNPLASPSYYTPHA